MKMEKRQVNKKEDNGQYLKLKDGESVIGVFRGEIYETFVTWENGRTAVATKGSPGAKSRFSANFLTQENGAYVAKVFDFSPTVYGQLYEINAEYPLETTKVKITRRGIKTDTVYIIMPSPKPLSQAEIAAISAVPLNILNPKAQQAQRPQDAFIDDEFRHQGPIFDDEKDQLPF